MKFIRHAVAAIAMAFGHHHVACNVAEGAHASGNLTLLADAALSDRNLRVKLGSDASHFAIAGAEAALGVCTDDPDTAEDAYNVALLGGVAGTLIGVGSGAIAAGDYLSGDTTGRFKTLPTSAGTYYVEGKAVTACGGNGQEFEFVPCLPYAVTVTE
jgi:hypothetical protein